MTKAQLSKLDLVTHPVRLRILLSLAGVERTPQQIAAALPDVPPSSIYRHLQILLRNGLLEVVAERQVRGTVEKTLRLREGAGSIGPDEARQMSPDDYRRAFLVFFTHLFAEFDRYLQQPDVDPVRDIVGFRAVPFHATDEEWVTAIRKIGEALRPLAENPPGAGRKLRTLATITLPTHDESQEQRS
jgi:DNA-binding transcriptional ArsR family regulator